MAAFTEIWSWFALKYSQLIALLTNWVIFFMSLGIVYFFIIFVRCQWQVVKPLHLFLFKGGVFYVINPPRIYLILHVFIFSFGIYKIFRPAAINPWEKRRQGQNQYTKFEFKMFNVWARGRKDLIHFNVLHADIQL